MLTQKEPIKSEPLDTIQQFRELSEIECKSQSTIRNYERHIKDYINHYGEKPEQKNIIKYLYYLRKNKRYDKSSLCVVKSALKYYYEEVLEQIITIKMPKIRKRKSMPKPLPQSIIKKIIDNIKNFKHMLLVEMAYDGGFRPSEIVNLMWVDIEWDNKRIAINRGKGDKDRYVYLSDKVLEDLKNFGEEEFKGIKNKDRKYIFFSEYKPDYHICKRTFEEIIKNVAKRLGINLRVYPYQLRHSFASHLKEKGIPIEDIQPRMGHSNIKTTMIYAKVSQPKERPATLMDGEYFNQKEIIRNSV